MSSVWGGLNGRCSRTTACLLCAHASSVLQLPRLNRGLFVAGMVQSGGQRVAHCCCASFQFPPLQLDVLNQWINILQSVQLPFAVIPVSLQSLAAWFVCQCTHSLCLLWLGRQPRDLWSGLWEAYRAGSLPSPGCFPAPVASQHWLSARLPRSCCSPLVSSGARLPVHPPCSSHLLPASSCCCSRLTSASWAAGLSTRAAQPVRRWLSFCYCSLC